MEIWAVHIELLTRNCCLPLLWLFSAVDFIIFFASFTPPGMLEMHGTTQNLTKFAAKSSVASNSRLHRFKRFFERVYAEVHNYFGRFLNIFSKETVKLVHLTTKQT